MKKIGECYRIRWLVPLEGLFGEAIVISHREVRSFVTEFLRINRLRLDQSGKDGFQNFLELPGRTSAYVSIESPPDLAASIEVDQLNIVADESKS